MEGVNKITEAVTIDRNVITYNIKGNRSDGLSLDKTTAIFYNYDKPIYKIKMDSEGHLFNPRKNDFSYGLEKKNKSNKESLFKFREVNKKCFDIYLKFLNTNQESLILLAEREI